EGSAAATERTQRGPALERGALHATPPRRARATARSRRRRRRSRSDLPPHTPHFSTLTSANSKHSARTSQARHTSLADSLSPPRGGKNRSGSMPRQFARACQSPSAVPDGEEAGGSGTTDRRRRGGARGVTFVTPQTSARAR